jgi:hypothetical protein
VKQLTLQSMREGRRPAGRRRSRAAFTLIEVILAVGLSTLLILCIASAIDLYRRMTTAATDDMSETRLVRAVFAKLEVDLRDVVPPQRPRAPVLAAAALAAAPALRAVPAPAVVPARAPVRPARKALRAPIRFNTSTREACSGSMAMLIRWSSTR